MLVLVRLDVKLVALERPDGLSIDRLLDAGLAVIAVHPNQVKASRPRYRAAGGKPQTALTVSCSPGLPAPTVIASESGARR